MSAVLFLEKVVIILAKRSNNSLTVLRNVYIGIVGKFLITFITNLTTKDSRNLFTNFALGNVTLNALRV